MFRLKDLATEKVTVISGPYGAGKTNVAVNLAMDIAKSGQICRIADLDIVNPYFRSADNAKMLEALGVQTMIPEFANTNVDIPALPQELYAITDDVSHLVVIDVGGDDRGALALGRISHAILGEGDYEMLLVINCYRPLTRDAESTLEVMHEIETAYKIRFTGLVNNSNLGAETTEEDVLSSLKYAEEVSSLTGLPVMMTAVHESLYDALADKVPYPFALHLQKKI
jgi:hypothetical protein